jgi:hypothetical protein
MNRSYRNQETGGPVKCRLPVSFIIGLLRLPRDGIFSPPRDKLIRMPRDETTGPLCGNFTRMPRDETVWPRRKVFTRMPRDETMVIHARLSRMPRDETDIGIRGRASRMPRDETLMRTCEKITGPKGVFKGSSLYILISMHIQEHIWALIRGRTRFRWRKCLSGNRLFRPVMGELHSLIYRE